MELALLLSVLPLMAFGLLSGANAEEAQDDGPQDETITGTEGADTLSDMSGDDLVIYVLGGDDDVSAGAGDDVIDAGAGNDFAFGGDGADTLRGDSGDDDLRGEAGQDSLAGGTGDDTLSGYTGADTLLGEDGDDVLDGDAVYAGTGETGTIFEADHLDGGAGNDTLFGGGARGFLPADAPIDTLIGGAGDDVIHDSYAIVWEEYSALVLPDADALIDAGTGDDTIDASGGDTITTGAGADVIALGTVPVGIEYGSEQVLVGECHVTVTDFTPGEDLLDITLIAPVDGVDQLQGSLGLREEGGNTILTFTDAETGAVTDGVVTLVGVTGLQLDDILVPPQPAVRAGTEGNDLRQHGLRS